MVMVMPIVHLVAVKEQAEVLCVATVAVLLSVVVTFVKILLKPLVV